MTPLKVFLDADVMFSAAYQETSGFDRLWSLQDVVLVTSYYCKEEVERNLPTKLQLDRFHFQLQKLTLVADCPEEALPTHFMLPRKDIPVLAAAMLASVDVLLTGDKRHFGPFYGTVQGNVRVESPEMFWQRFSDCRA